MDHAPADLGQRVDLPLVQALVHVAQRHIAGAPDLLLRLGRQDPLQALRRVGADVEAALSLDVHAPIGRGAGSCIENA
eukprot:CAMPEP_0179357804 /NCGR_PEP_ID=MMETSP0797-20121207/78596_1 /TAXON_ID=47934 /ORGANISM="Dinophysis acuminata, Strain DAEP01" /LENGTH=77 /DNA_ID=CAMNT_0021073031 /DNA_START=337 /DNA_END=567 /DNA_ORIENTATION=-